MKNSVSKVNEMNNLTIGFLENNLKLEGMQITEEEKLICEDILAGKIDLEEYKKMILK